MTDNLILSEVQTYLQTYELRAHVTHNPELRMRVCDIRKPTCLNTYSDIDLHMRLNIFVIIFLINAIVLGRGLYLFDLPVGYLYNVNLPGKYYFDLHFAIQSLLSLS